MHLPPNLLEIDQFWNELKRHEMCMLVTRDARFLRSRPMRAHFDDDDGTVRFLTSIDAHKVDELAAEPLANLVFSQPEENSWVSVSGAARISVDRADIDSLWSDGAEAWSPPSKAEAAVLIVEPDIAEFWSYPENRLKAKWELLKGELTGNPPDLGNHARVSF